MKDSVVKERSLKVAWYWKVMIACMALTLGLATVILIPPLPDISLGFANHHLAVGLIVTNSATAPIRYRDITAAAFFAGEPYSEVSLLTPFRQSAGEVSRVWFQLRQRLSRGQEEGYTVMVRARAAYAGAVWPAWKEIEVRAVCQAGEGKCEVDGVWIWRERLLFVAVFVMPLLVYIFIVFVFSQQ